MMEMLALAYFFVGFTLALYTTLHVTSEEFQEFHIRVKGVDWKLFDTVVLGLWCFFLWPVMLFLAYKVFKGD